jgi:hypothetical protein
MIRLHPRPLPRQQIVSLSQFSCVSPVQLTGGGGGGGPGAEILQPHESLCFCKSFNRLCLRVSEKIVPFVIRVRYLLLIMYSVSERYIPGTVNKLLNQLSVKGLFIAFYSVLSVLRYGTVHCL